VRINVVPGVAGLLCAVLAVGALAAPTAAGARSCAYAADWCSDGRYDDPVQCEPIVEWVRARDAHNTFNFVGVDTITRLELCADRSVILLGTSAPSTRKALKVSYSSGPDRTLAEDPGLDLRSLTRRHGRAAWSLESGRHGSAACA
jgi:hypothetical protein